MSIHPTVDDQQDFLRKVLPIGESLAAEKGIPFKTRFLNLVMYGDGKTKAERAFVEEVLRRVWQAYPGDDYPKMCARPPEPQPVVH